MELTGITLETVAKGAAGPRFQQELEKVIENILDVNTAAEEARSITIKVTFKPRSDRGTVGVKLAASSKLASKEAVMGIMYVGQMKDGTLVAQGQDPGQRSMFDDEGEEEGVLPMDPKREATNGHDS